MFKPVSMLRLTLHLLREDAAIAALILAQHGTFNSESAHAMQDELPDIPGERYRELHSSAYARLNKIRAFCGEPHAPAVVVPRVVTEQELVELDSWLQEVWAECSRYQEQARSVEEARKRVTQLLKTLDNFAALDIDLGQLQQNRRFLDIQLGAVATSNVVRLTEALGIAGYVVRPFLVSEGSTLVAAAGPVGREHELRAVLQAAGWHAMQIPPEFHSHPDQVRAELTAELARIEQDNVTQCNVMRETASSIGQRLAEAARTLSLAAPYAELAAASLRSRGGLAVITGWAPQSDLPALHDALRERLSGRFVIAAQEPLRDEMEQVPSLTRYPRWLLPFSKLVANYGVPRYGEIDPTWLFAATYIVMFGMMFGDVGQGAVIALAGFILRRRLAGFTPFFLAAGVSSMLFGGLYGSVFGFEEIIQPLWISPLSDPIRMLTVAIYWGVSFILLVTFLSIINRLAEGNVREALLDSKGMAGLIFYIVFLLMAGRWAAGHAPGAGVLAVLILSFSAVAYYKWHEVQGQTWERALGVFIEMFETVLNNIANTLSFLRVAAFSLNHVALAFAVFTVAGMLGPAGHWIAVVAGNVFIIALEGAIVAIQILRLEYYEGFSRFFRGDGRKFRPLRLAAEENT